MNDIRAALADRYRIERELGAGGMATVYLAEDVKHARKVAVKVLHPDLAAALGAERFLAEITTTANLQHPHILPLHDSGEANGFLFYVMPFVDGESLRDRLTRETQLPLDDAVRIAREMADALGYAHSHGVIHRDIKPENILLQGGHALVADFGIALAVQSAGGQRMTQTGLSLGTPQYMSPEQAMGERAIDARTDIYALGAVTYEMLAGDPPFTGSSVQAIVAKVMTERPTPLSTVRDTVPDNIEQAVLKALAKLPADRFASAREFTDALASATPRHDRGHAPAREYAASRRARTVALSAALVVAAALAVAGWMRPAPSVPVTRVALALPPAQAVQPQYFGFAISVSPDGRRIAYVGPGPSMGTTQVWIRALDALSSSTLPNSLGAVGVQWSPDARSLLVTKLRQETFVLSAAGDGQALPLGRFQDGAWGPGGRVYGVLGAGVIVRQAIGGVPDTLFRPDTQFIFSHPMPLGEGGSALAVRVPRVTTEIAASEIVGLTFATAKVTLIARGVYARVLRSGALLYVASDGNVFVAPFDAGAMRLTGAPVAVARVVMSSNTGRSYPQISVSDEGTLVYLSGSLQRQRVAWLDARGRLERRLAIEGDIWGIALSPDATRLAFTLKDDARDVGAASRGSGDVWVEELATGARTRLTDTKFNPRPSWSPDGKSVMYARVGGPTDQALYERRADASEPEHLVLSMKQLGHTLGDGRWLPDHRTLLVRTYADGDRPANVYFTTAGSTDNAQPVAVTPAEEVAPTPSPDGSLVAYLSDESGTRELYVQRFPIGAERIVVSSGGASPPRWSHDGHALYYWDQRGRLIVASIAARPALAITGTRQIDAEAIPGRWLSNAQFDVAADGRIILAEDVASAFDLVLVRNWPAALRGESHP
jgi:Tol biopolymer transport system component/tRNA A-37 threonylcarbamoyl transferase component Bud32